MIKCSKLYFPKIHTFNNIFDEPIDVPDIVLVLGLYSSRENKVSTFMELMFKWKETTKTRILNVLGGISSVQFSHSVVSDSLQPYESQHARPPCPSQTPGVYSNSCPSSRLCHPVISSSVVPFSSCPQTLPASGCFPLFA